LQKKALQRHDALHFFQKDLFVGSLGLDAMPRVNFGKAGLFHAPIFALLWG
jgi:hypothetical protein